MWVNLDEARQRVQEKFHYQQWLVFLNGSFVSYVYKKCNIKSFTRMVRYVVSNGMVCLSKDITENIIKFQVGNG